MRPRPGRVQRRLPYAGQAGGVAGDEEEERAGAGVPAGVRRDEEQARAVPVEHLVGLPVQPPRAVRAPRLHAPCPAAARPGTPVVAGEPERDGETGPGCGEGGGEGAVGKAREQPGALGVGAEGEQQRGRQDGGGEQRRGREGPSGLLGGEGEVRHRAADTAVRLRQREPREAERVGESGPQAGVVPGGQADGRAHPGGVPAEQVPQRAADLVLLGREGGVHGRPPGSDGSSY
ncbi:hypothetical protein RKD23_004282 [Streptomyces sp. SAI-170]